MNEAFRTRVGTLLIGSIAALTLAADVAAAAEDAGFPAPVDNADILPDGAKLERLFDGGCVLSEGVAVAPDGMVYFSDITFTKLCRHPEHQNMLQAGNIWRYDPETGETTVFRSPSGMSNGLKFDAEGNLLAAEGADYGGRRITLTDMETGRSYILAGLYNGQPFNAPNDITIDERGRIYFSDPRYLGHEPVQQPVMAVYRIDPDGSVERIITNAGKPNGVLVSPDQSTLYVVSNDDGVMDFQRLEEGEKTVPGAMKLWAYDLNEDGTASNRRELQDYAPEAGPDGLIADTEGNVYAAVRRTDKPGIYVYSPDGEELAFISTGEELPTNVGFGRGDESNVLYVTSGKSLYRIETNKEGYQLPSAS